METRRGLFTKAGLLVAGAVSLVIIGKKHIAAHREARHMDEFNETNYREEFELEDDKDPFDERRESQYVGAGMSYASRTPGDRLSMWSVFKSKTGANNK